jgi:phosphotransacetylase
MRPNLLVFPHLNAANITLNVLKTVKEALHVGPILPGAARSSPYFDALGHLAWSI